MPELPPQQCITRMLNQADRLGVEVHTIQQQPSRPAVGFYFAKPGRPGRIDLHTSDTTSPITKCRLITHEMVHLLQHWHAGFRAVLPLGWPVDGEATEGRSLSPHEAEAFTAQEQPRKVLRALKKLNPISP
ncbi:hypothetical protein [Synechococcus sp. UW179A]|uniref:hypothetical protein n=1 Tax=Synechococcus sp. UW179A TaxID=2575510 RepID=UPI000E0EADE9|nr:hypothetical protein [Synechococcus sp. UW179A]